MGGCGSCGRGGKGSSSGSQGPGPAPAGRAASGQSLDGPDPWVLLANLPPRGLFPWLREKEARLGSLGWRARGSVLAGWDGLPGWVLGCPGLHVPEQARIHRGPRCLWGGRVPLSVGWGGSRILTPTKRLMCQAQCVGAHSNFIATAK